MRRRPIDQTARPQDLDILEPLCERLNELLQRDELLWTSLEQLWRTAESPGAVPEGAGLHTPSNAELSRKAARALMLRVRLRNLAERAADLRVCSTTPWAEIFEDLRHQGFSPEQIREALESLAFEPVLAADAHEATDPTLLDAERAIFHSLHHDRLDGSIADSVRKIWSTAPKNQTRPSVREQREHVLRLAASSLFPLYGDLIERMEAGFLNAFRDLDEPWGSTPFLPCGSWVGGDMDGNPYVNADTVRAGLARHRQKALELLDHRLEQLQRSLPEELRSRAQSRLRERLQTPGSSQAQSFDSPEQMDAELSILQDHPACDEDSLSQIKTLRRLLQNFGFHLVTLHQRQDGAFHREVIGHLLIDDRWSERPASSRSRRIRQLLKKAKTKVAPPGSPAIVHQALASFRALAHARNQGIGDSALGPYVVGMSQGVDDVLGVLLLARWAGWTDEGQVPLDICPLFETVEDLANAPSILEELLALPLYAQHVAARRGRQIVMLGYAETNKDAGPFCSRWAIRRAQEAMLEVARRQPGIELRFLHGRCGSTAGSFGSAPLDDSPGRIWSSEPSETLSSRFGAPETALKVAEDALIGALKRLTSVTASTTAGPSQAPRNAMPTSWGDIAETVSRESKRCYRDLVLGERRFFRFFRLATPIDVIERLMTGNRPAGRSSRAGVANLRATPWIMAWNQSRMALPAWLGVGSGLAAAVEEHGQDQITEALRDWPWLSELVGSAERALAKTDWDVAGRFVALAGELGSKVFPDIEDEMERTRSLILRLKDHDRLLEGEPEVAQAIARRRLDTRALSLMQVELLRSWRDGGRDDERLLDALLTTTHGLTQALKDFG